jgi:DNA end-binding protein Ku
MAARTSWEGYLRLNLLSVPVKAYSATVSGGGRIGFHLLHAKCNSRIHYKKVCPIHGEVPNEEIVSGYEFAKGKYVTVEPEELDKLLPENEKSIDIDVFIRPKDLDPIYYDGRTYYLVPDGRVAQKPYAVLQRVMAEHERYAVATVIFSGREQLVLVRPMEGLLAMTMLSYEDQIKTPASFQDDVPDVSVGAAELKLAESLVEASTAHRFDFSKYEDQYSGKLTKLLEAKSAGKKVAPKKGHDEPVVINLMDALRKSLDRTKRGAAATNGKAKSAKAKAAARKTRRTSKPRKTG